MNIQFLHELSIPIKPGSHESKGTDQHVELFWVYHQIICPSSSMQNIAEKTLSHVLEMIDVSDNWFQLFVNSRESDLHGLCVVCQTAS